MPGADIERSFRSRPAEASSYSSCLTKEIPEVKQKYGLRMKKLITSGIEVADGPLEVAEPESSGLRSKPPLHTRRNWISPTAYNSQPQHNKEHTVSPDGPEE